MDIKEIMELTKQRFPECEIFANKCDYRKGHDILISVSGFDGFTFYDKNVENVFDLAKLLEGASVIIKYYLKKKGRRKKK